MARTKTQPRTSTGGVKPVKPLRNRWRLPHNVRFNDHTGKPALMSWGGEESADLPPLGSWAFYMVHPDITLTPEFDGFRFQQELDNSIGQGMHRGNYFRFEFFFLPGATVEECHAHYLAEMKARVTIWRQIRKVKKIMAPRREQIRKELRELGELEEEDWDEEGWNELNEEEGDINEEQDETNTDKHPKGQLPGLVWPKDNDYDTQWVGYRGWFFIYPDDDISLKGEIGLNRDIYLVQFDPVPLPERDTFTFNPMDHPVNAQKMKARVDGTDEGIWGWIYYRMNSVWALEANEATRDAMQLEWKSW